jgi:hypothetical protein
MSRSQLTDDRLRTRTLSQADRERLAADVLGLDQRYSLIKLRHPLGGPDGGRDLEAIYEGSVTVWGAVGFQNMVSDSPDEKKQTVRKFKFDLGRMKQEFPALSRMVFFTNTALTVAELGELCDHGQKQGTQIDIYDRERLRAVLDNSMGLMYRLRYLDLEMTREEQLAFFTQHGQELEGMIHGHFAVVKQRLERLQFEMECRKPLVQISVVLRLNTEYSPEQLGHFRFLAVIQNRDCIGPDPALCIGGRDQWVHGSSDTNPTVQNVIWSRNPDDIIDMASGQGCGNRELLARIRLQGRGPFTKLGNLQYQNLRIFVSENLIGKLAGIYLVANEYVLVSVNASDLEHCVSKPWHEWPERAEIHANQLPWLELGPRGINSMMGRFGGLWNPWDLGFAHNTPERVLRPQGFRVPEGVTIGT